MQKFHEVKEKIFSHTKNIPHRKLLSWSVYLLVFVVIASLLFQAGVHVGYRKATFGKDWDEHYAANFGPRPRGPIHNMEPQFPNGHGALGKIASVSLPTIIVIEPNALEKIIVVDATTKIIEGRTPTTTASLVPDATIAVIGTPNSQGQIVAKFIRILPTGPAL